MDKLRIKKVKKFLKEFQSRSIQAEDNNKSLNVKKFAKEFHMSASLIGTARKYYAFDNNTLVTDKMVADIIDINNKERNDRRTRRKERVAKECEQARKDAYLRKEKIDKLELEVYNLKAKINSQKVTINTAQDLHEENIQENIIVKQQVSDLEHTIQVKDKMNRNLQRQVEAINREISKFKKEIANQMQSLEIDLNRWKAEASLNKELLDVSESYNKILSKQNAELNKKWWKLW